MSLFNFKSNSKYLIIRIKYLDIIPIHIIRYEIYNIINKQLFDINEIIKLIQIHNTTEKILLFFIKVYTNIFNLKLIIRYINKLYSINSKLLIVISGSNNNYYYNILYKYKYYTLTIYKKNIYWNFICRHINNECTKNCEYFNLIPNRNKNI